ncbi:dihydropteroate synthase [Acinetobacter rudis]|uniref:Dihydropteroate synthase n=1 Tax=Acinetobacter rudis CIP 110305 TaxID=421052 RepID=S3NNP9_9GAMM|nr:dihydropteroate synthase [Acinetobacter rudis]EPF80018.1 dihydropteroate synthase [Acinetobacter rudis CIP 110305]
MRLMPLPAHQLQCGRLQLDLSVPHIMGILNVTPDSFSDGGKYLAPDHAIQHALQMIADGATVIDVGGESTRPGASVVSEEEEMRRVIPVVQALSQYDVVISIDTSTPAVMREAVAVGAHIWNDVRGLTRPQALETAVALDIPVILMHMRGEPDTMNSLAQYDHVTTEVIQELQQRIDQALRAGVKAEHIILDPGFGFAKNTAQNLQLLNEFDQLHQLGYPVMSALSRKRFLGEIIGETAADQRAVSSVMAHLICVQQGACMLRVHDVKATADALKVWQAMQALTLL